MNVKKIGILALTGLIGVSSIVSANSIIRGKSSMIEGHYIDFDERYPKPEVEVKEELRATWISTVYNLDFPTKKGLSEDEFKKEYITLLNNINNLKLNTVIFQVRPKGDTFYESDLNPWSEFLTGEEGKSPNWDPMKWMVEETHSRGIAFEAWFNPYRVTTASNKNTTKMEDINKLSINNYAKKNPDKVFKYDGKLYLNPAEPEVIDYITKTIMEVVNKYDIDGVHLDDYFYPSKRSNIESFYSKEEENSFNKYKKDFKNVSDWRRDNVNTLVSNINKSIKDYNDKNEDNVVFGISPFGIWGHKINHPEGSIEGVGSNTPATSMESYKYQFADTRKWVKESMIDYIAPQIYWTFDEKAAPYGELVSWWANTVKDTDVNLYIGHANYKQSEAKVSKKWSNPREISNQLKYNDQFEEVKGSIFFRYKSLLKGINPVNDKFLNILSIEHYNEVATTPEFKNKVESK